MYMAQTDAYFPSPLSHLALNVEEMLANGQYHEAVLPLPTCQSGSGCRAVIQNANNPQSRDFTIPELFHIQTQVIICMFTIE